RAAAGDAVLYGWNLLVGETAIDGETVEVEMLGNVSYREGSGPFFGFVTLTFPDGSTIGLRMDNGEAKANAGTQTHFTAKLTVLGGTGRYLDVKGSGRWEGGRDTAVGSEVHMDVRLKLRGID